MQLARDRRVVSKQAPRSNFVDISGGNTMATSEDAVHKALAAVRRDRVVYGRPQVIRIERA
jgi:hypothetical protein